MTGSRTAAGLLVAACAIPALWPGDVPFINDEPLLIAAAAAANARHGLAPMGLLGTYGFSYGPAPTWMYQVLVAVTHDLVVVAALHALLMAAVTAAALWWLSRSLGLWVWFAPVPLVSPYFWFYARVLWDNPLLIPLGALAIAGYSAHLRSGSSAGLRIALAAMVASLLVHLMSVALVVPLLAHMVFVRRRELWAHRASLAAIAIASMVAAWPYWRYLATAHPPAAGTAATFDGWIFPLLGARLLSAQELGYFFGTAPVAGPLLATASAVSMLAYVLVWSGIGIAVWRIVGAIRARHWTPDTHIAAIVLGMLACQSAIDGMAGKFQHPQYQNATWIATVMLAWFTVDGLARLRGSLRWSAPAAAGLLASALLLAVGVVAGRLHRTGGTREIYGPTLGNQQRVARALSRHSSRSRVTTDVVLYELYPHTLAILRGLNPPRAWAPDGDLAVRYASADPASGTIEVAER